MLNVARQDYEPQGASVTILVSEEVFIYRYYTEEGPESLPDSVVNHLDKSHMPIRILKVI